MEGLLVDVLPQRTLAVGQTEELTNALASGILRVRLKWRLSRPSILTVDEEDLMRQPALATVFRRRSDQSGSLSTWRWNELFHNFETWQVPLPR